MGFLKNISDPDAGDQELVSRYQSTGDLELLSALYQRYIDLVYGVCLKYLPDAETAKDAVMAIFESLISKLQKYPVTYFKGWLFTVAKNHCLMQLRSGAKGKIVDFDADRMQMTEESHLEDVMAGEQRLQELSDCLNGLAPAQKASVELFYYQQKSYKEIAVITGQESEKVRSLIQNGRRNLKICMEQKSIRAANE